MTREWMLYAAAIAHLGLGEKPAERTKRPRPPKGKRLSDTLPSGKPQTTQTTAPSEGQGE